MTTTVTPAAEDELRTALAGICAQTPIDPTSASLIKWTINAVFQAGTDRQFVLRLARGPAAGERARRVVAAAKAMAAVGVPVIALAPEVPEQPVEHDGWAATIWHCVPTIAEGGRPIDLARPLRALHRLPALPVELPAWNTIDKCRDRLTSATQVARSQPALYDSWSRTELGLPFAALVEDLTERHARIAEALSSVAWRHPGGPLHGDAHTGNLILPAAEARPHEAALLCDLDSVATGPREWDLVPTAHGVTRFGRSRADYDAFTAAYGDDLLTWPSWPVLRDLRELQVITSVLDGLEGRPDVARELAHRIRTLRAGDVDATWHRYR